MHQRWEYKIVHFRTDQFTSTGIPSDLNQHFDEYGAEGWELVSTESMLSHLGFFPGTRTIAIIAFFKRPLAT